MCFLLSTNIYILRKKTSFLRKKGVGAWLGGPSQNHPATFPKRPRDLPHGIQLWRHSEPLLPGKVRHPFGEGLLFPPGTFPITLASQGPLRHFRWGRSRHFFETFPKSPCHLPQGIQSWLLSVPLLPGKVHHPIPVQIAIITQDAAALSSKVAKNAVLF